MFSTTNPLALRSIIVTIVLLALLLLSSLWHVSSLSTNTHLCICSMSIPTNRTAPNHVASQFCILFFHIVALSFWFHFSLLARYVLQKYTKINYSEILEALVVHFSSFVCLFYYYFSLSLSNRTFFCMVHFGLFSLEFRIHFQFVCQHKSIAYASAHARVHARTYVYILCSTLSVDVLCCAIFGVSFNKLALPKREKTKLRNVSASRNLIGSEKAFSSYWNPDANNMKQVHFSNVFFVSSG